MVPSQHVMAYEESLSRGGAPSAKVAATLASCGLGGFHCATGGQSPLCHVRCCRVDFPENASACLICGTCGCGCFLWPYWAARCHKMLKVDFYKLAFFNLTADTE